MRPPGIRVGKSFTSGDLLSVGSEQCKEPLLSEKQNSHRMTPTDGRSRTTSESKDTATTTVSTTTTTNGQAAAANSTTDDCFDVTIFDEGIDGGRLPDVVAESKIYGVANEDEPLESYLAITIQVFIPFLIAGLGMVGAGLVLDLVQVRMEFTLIVTNPRLRIILEILCRNSHADRGNQFDDTRS